MKLKLQLVLLMICFFGAASIAAPIKIEDRHEYSTSLNSIAFMVMNWYGSLIAKDADGLSADALSKNTTEIDFNTINIGDRWLEYRSQYPSNITQVLITHTELFKLDNEYQFNVSTNISYKNNKNEIQTQSLKETFLFSDALTSATQAQANTSPLVNINLLKREEITPLYTEGYNREHYKVREFVYAWLGYLDGLNHLSSGMNGNEWLNKASYSLQMGSDKTQSSVKKALSKRKKTLAKGGHLLRTLDVKKSTDDDNTFSSILSLSGKDLMIKINPS